MLVGTSDSLADTKDNHWAHDKMKNDVVFYKEYNLGHLSFMVAKDMSYFNDVKALLAKYQPIKAQEFLQ